MNSLRRLVHQNSIAFIEFVRHCRDENRVLHPNHVAVLKMAALLQDSGRVHHQIRDIVLSAVINDGVEMEIVNPLAK